MMPKYNTKKMINKCVICNNSMNFLLKKNGYNLYSCKSCDLITIFPKPSKRELNRIYSPKNNYHSKFNKNFLIKQKKEFNRRLSTAGCLIDKKNRSVIDMGCSNGDFLDCAKKYGYKTFGIELNKTTAKISKDKGHNIFNGRFLDYKTNKNFNLIHLGDVIEHDLNPIKVIKKCKELISKEGILIVSTPNVDSFFPKVTLQLSRVFNLNWSHATPPHHIYQFSFNNLNLLLQKNNFKLCEVYYKNIPLKYELEQIRYFNKFRKYLLKKSHLRKALINLFLFTVTSTFYIPLYFINIIITFLGGKGTEMIVIFK